MDRCLYEAIMKDDITVLDEYNSEKLEDQVTPIDETVLHVAAQFGSKKYVKRILEMCPSMARRRHDITGNTALHVAVREGYVDIAKTILDCGRDLESGDGVTHELLRATNKVGDTALHLAVRRQRPIMEMVKLLLQEDPEFQLPPNNAEETPLYIAAEMRHVDVMDMFLKNCTSLVVRGPCGRTVLHAAVIRSRSWGSEACAKLLLDAGNKYGIDLIKVKDVYGWTPLHYAARNGDSVIAKLILEREKSAAYIGTENDNNTPLHLAAAAGSTRVMKTLLSCSPDCWGIVNKKGYNVLHVAVDMEQEQVLKYMGDLPILRFLINQQDEDGNTPLHLLAEKKKRKWNWRLYHDLANVDIFNNQNLTPLDLLRGDDFEDYYGGRNIVEEDFNKIRNYRKRWYNTEEGQKARQQKFKEYKEAMKKMGETHLIVATLVTTIAFTAAFTIPGGYDGNPGSNQGLAVLVKMTVFKVFAIANSIALVSSLTSVIVYIVVSFCYYSETGKLNILDSEIEELKMLGAPTSVQDLSIEIRASVQEVKIAMRYTLALLLVMIAIGAMMVAFVAGTYVILARSLGLAISTTTIGCLPFIAYVREVIQILRAVKSLKLKWYSLF